LAFPDNNDNRASIAFAIKPSIRPSKAWTTSSTITEADCPPLELTDEDVDAIVAEFIEEVTELGSVQPPATDTVLTEAGVPQSLLFLVSRGISTVE
jgi:hypothetical protein